RLDGTTIEEPEQVAERKKYNEEVEHAEYPRDYMEAHKGPAVTARQVLWALADDLAANQGESDVVVGPGHAPEVHALAYEINSLLGNLGKTVVFTEEPEPEVARGTIGDLAAAIDTKQVEVL